MSVRSDLAAIERRLDAIGGGGVPRPSSAQVATFERFVRPGTIVRAIEAGAHAAGLDPALVAAVAQTESSGNPYARSAAGAEGLMQLMPETARTLGVIDAYDPAQNARGGAAYLRSLVDRFGDLRSALAAYNAGPGAVVRYGGVPPYAETRAYVDRVLRAYDAHRDRSRDREF